MNKKLRYLTLAAVAVLAAAGSAALNGASGIAVSAQPPGEPSLTVPQPQPFDVAQAEGTHEGAAPISPLPGGASALNETYQDWSVSCIQQDAQKRCTLSQVQVQQNGQRVLAVELDAPAGNVLSGMLVLPFGLALDSGVTFQVDEQSPMQPVRFRTCLPGGCLVPITLDAPAIVALRAGAVLKVAAMADAGSPAPFSISLQGFGTALDRVVVLAQ